MTIERQDIMEDFYAGNYKELAIHVTNKDGSDKDLTGAEVTYAIFTDKGVVKLYKSSNDGDLAIELTEPSQGRCIVYCWPWDTALLSGTFRHHVNVVDVNGKEETVLVGTVRIFTAYARRQRTDSQSGYLLGTSA